jgi:hypothetical protein
MTRTKLDEDSCKELRMEPSVVMLLNEGTGDIGLGNAPRRELTPLYGHHDKEIPVGHETGFLAESRPSLSSRLRRDHDQSQLSVGDSLTEFGWILARAEL